MLSVVYYVACSLDGYIATPDGGGELEQLALAEVAPFPNGVVQLTYASPSSG